MFCKKGVLEIIAKFTGKHLRQSLFFKKTLTQVFLCEFCNIFKNTFFTEQLRATASLNTFSDCFTCNKISNIFYKMKYGSSKLSNCSQVLYEKAALMNFIEKHPCWILSFN